MTETALDPRVHAFDPLAHIAELALQGRLDGDGWRYVTPQSVQVGNARISLRKKPDWEAPQVTEALPGEALELLWENAEGWALVRTLPDRYLGWTPAPGFMHAVTRDALMITALRAHAYAGPKVSQPVVAQLCLGARLLRREGEVVADERRRWVPVHLPDWTAAWVPEVTLCPIQEGDEAALALRFLEVPYVWGGRSAWGLDCSGLTQTVFAAFGRCLPRDADQQQTALPRVDSPQRGDLAFFPGHVGLMLDERRMIHANATHMRVTIETLGEGEYGQRLQSSLTGFGRWQA